MSGWHFVSGRIVSSGILSLVADNGGGILSQGILSWGILTEGVLSQGIMSLHPNIIQYCVIISLLSHGESMVIIIL